MVLLLRKLRQMPERVLVGQVEVWSGDFTDFGNWYTVPGKVSASDV
jgi:hypothetical protein